MLTSAAAVNIYTCTQSVAIVTGSANGGIGWGIAKHCALQLNMVRAGATRELVRCMHSQMTLFATCVAHVLNTRLIEVRELRFLVLSTKVQLIDEI